MKSLVFALSHNTQEDPKNTSQTFQGIALILTLFRITCRVFKSTDAWVPLPKIPVPLV